MRSRHLYQMKEMTDEELVLAYQQEEENAYVGELFERYAELVFLVGMKYLKNEEEAKDVAMYVFEKLLSDLKRYEVRAFKFWLHRVVKNHCLAVLDKAQRARQKNELYKEEQEVVEFEHEPALPHEERPEELQLKYLHEAIAQLKEEQKECIELFYLQKKSYQEVADLTGFDMKQVKSYIQNGKRNLKNHLMEMGVDGMVSVIGLLFCLTI